MKVTVVIPARYGSTRFPGKPLVNISGKPMIQHVFERASQASLVDDVFVATDDQRIEEAVQQFHGKVILTRSDLETGTDRVAEVARNFSSDIFINVQGDEPFISPKLIDQISSTLISDPHIKMASAGISLKTKDSFLDPNVVKVLTDRDSFAIYFSRYPIPFLKQGWPPSERPGRWDDYFQAYSFEEVQKTNVKKHVGIYGFRRETLLQFAQWEPTPLECQEGLEQLRALEHGVKIRIIPTEEESMEINTPQDLNKLSDA